MAINVEAAPGAVAAPAESGLEWRRMPWIPFLILAALVLVALLAPVISPHSPTAQ